jgi:hypothetical protein
LVPGQFHTDEPKASGFIERICIDMSRRLLTRPKTRSADRIEKTIQLFVCCLDQA